MADWRINAAKTHCPKGHPYAGDNVTVDNRGWRRCKKCRAEAAQRYKAARDRSDG